MYYLQNVGAGFVGNSPLWWHKSDSGYTPRLDDAKQFTPGEAHSIIRTTRGTHKWKKWHVKEVDAVAHRTVDIQDLK